MQVRRPVEASIACRQHSSASRLGWQRGAVMCPVRDTPVPMLHAGARAHLACFVDGLPAECHHCVARRHVRQATRQASGVQLQRRHAVKYACMHACTRADASEQAGAGHDPLSDGLVCLMKAWQPAASTTSKQAVGTPAFCIPSCSLPLISVQLKRVSAQRCQVPDEVHR